MKEKIEKMRSGKGFIAALDQSGGSTPKALKLYKIEESAYKNDAEMFDLIHQMRTRDYFGQHGRQKLHRARQGPPGEF